MKVRDMRSLGVLSGIVAAMALITGCGGYPTDGDESGANTQMMLDRVQRKLQPQGDDSGFANAPLLQTQEAQGGTPVNLISADKLLPVNLSGTYEGQFDDAFAAAVAISGSTAIVGAPDRDDVGGNSGSVYVFSKDSGSWALTQKLTAKDGTVADNFGFSLAIEGNRLLVGARRAAGLNGLETGAVYVYERADGKTWTLTAKIVPPDGGYEDFFGYAVALSGDLALIGAPQADFANIETGAAYVYKFDGTKWAMAKKLTPQGGGQNDFYGGAVALIKETPIFGPTAMVATWNDNQNPGSDDGAVFVYVDPDPATFQPWGLQAKLVASDQTPGDTFGFSISTYGQTAFIGSPLRSRECDYTGAVYVFGRHSGVWCEETIIVPKDKNAGQLFGYSTTVFGDTAVIGSAYDDDAGDYSGSAYVYTYVENQWSEKFKFVPNDATFGQLVGYSTAMDGDEVVVGALYDAKDGINAGAAYLFSVLEDPNAPPATLVADNTQAQCSMKHGTTSNRSALFIGIGLAAMGLRRASRKIRVNTAKS